MKLGKTALRSVAFAFAIFAVPMIVTLPAQDAFAANTVKVVVNKTPITVMTLPDALPFSNCSASLEISLKKRVSS